MTDTQASSEERDNRSAAIDIPAIGGPVRGSWCEWTLARAGELEALSNFWVRPRGPQNFWVRPRGPQNNDEVLMKAICSHLHAARQAAQRPAGRTILTGLAWSAGLVPWSTADGMIRLRL